MALTSSITLISDSKAPCGVESFARQVAARLSTALPRRHETFAITAQPGEVDILRRTMADREALIIHLPIVGWKKRIVAPARYMMAARRLGKGVILVLHEWADLDWKRRATYLAYLPFATRILFSSPLIRNQFAADPRSKICTADRGLVPIPPNLKCPETLPTTALAAKLASIKASGKLLLGHFGSIYPKKQSTFVLEVAASLQAIGQPVHAVFIGSFINGGTVDPKRAFDVRVAELGLTNDVTITGYIGPAAEVFAALNACDVFVYSFAEGLTSRRSSVLTCLQINRPVLVNAPAAASEFKHHRAFVSAMSAGGLTLLSSAATPAAFAFAVQNSGACHPDFQLDYEAAWDDVITAFGDLKSTTGKQDLASSGGSACGSAPAQRP
jgi:glycosyltransferase involved in cell wall biosynthesis